MGNKAFLNKNYEEAIEMYSKAIEEDPQDPVYYTNSMIKCDINDYLGAMVFITTEDFNRAIEDCDRAIEINKTYVKVRFWIILFLMIIGLY